MSDPLLTAVRKYIELRDAGEVLLKNPHVSQTAVDRMVTALKNAYADMRFQANADRSD